MQEGSLIIAAKAFVGKLAKVTKFADSIIEEEFKQELLCPPFEYSVNQKKFAVKALP